MAKWIQLKYIFSLTVLILFFLMLYSLLQSGYHYQLDNDEYYHSQIVYLIDHGQTIYRSFYSIYTPIYYWILLPVFHASGYGFAVLLKARAFMGGLFLLRLVFLYLGIRLLVSHRAAIIGLLLLMFDQFAVMTVMQIRPDNVMLLFLTIAFCLYIYARKKNISFFYFLTGSFLALSVVSLFKIAPTVVSFLLIAIVSSIQRKTLKAEALALFGFVGTLALLFLVFSAQGLARDLFQQAFLDPLLIFNQILYPIPYNFFFKEGNMFVFGLANRSLAWVYLQLLYPLGGASMSAGLTLITQKNTSRLLKDIIWILLLSISTQWLWLITVPSIFIQYYLPIHWIIAVLAGIGIDHVLSQHEKTWMNRGFYLACLLFLILFSYGNYNTNIFRSHINTDAANARLTAFWKIVPENKAIFPSILFRPIAYPMPYRVDFHEIPASIVARYPSVSSYLEKGNTEYIYNDGGIIGSLSQTDQDYIRAHFSPKGKNDEVFIRN